MVQAGVWLAVDCVSVAGGHSCKVKRVNAEGEKKNEKANEVKQIFSEVEILIHSPSLV